MLCSRFSTCDKAPSAVEMTLIAWVELLTAWLMPLISACKPWLAIKPDGLSAPVLICKPVLKRCREVCSEVSDVVRFCCAYRDATFVTILLDMPILQIVGE